MADPVTILWQCVLALSYVFLVIQKRNGLWLFWAGVFALTAVYIRYSIDVDAVRDFDPYFASFLQVKYEGLSITSVFEPYRVALFKTVLLSGDLDDHTQIGLVYYFHFAVVTSFFIWLAYYKDVTFEAKLILFLAFYPTMAFVWLRSGMAYVVACYLLLTITNRKFRFLHYAPPLIHVSVLPLLVALKAKDLDPLRKTLVILAAPIIAYLIYESSYVQYILEKLSRYAETDENRDSIQLLLFHIANVLLFIYLSIINSSFRRNFAVLALMGAYLVMYMVNPVAGLRVFPLVLISSIVQRITFSRYRLLTLVISAAYVPVYVARFDQVRMW